MNWKINKLIIVIFFITQYYNFGNYWIYGYSIPNIVSYVIDSNGICKKWIGHKTECNEKEIFAINKIKEYEI